MFFFIVVYIKNNIKWKWDEISNVKIRDIEKELDKRVSREVR